MISFPLPFVCLFLIVTIFMSFKNVPYGALILWSNFQLQKIDLFYFCYQGLLTVPGVFCRTPNQALGFQIPWITYFRFHAHFYWNVRRRSILVLNVCALKCLKLQTPLWSNWRSILTWNVRHRSCLFIKRFGPHHQFHSEIVTKRPPSKCF